MPFTLAHPAGALPFKWIKRNFFSTTGLIVGSMAPDYEYFLKQQPSPTLSETVWGSFLFNLPLAIILALVFHLLVKRPLVRHLPSPYDQRYSGYAHNSFLSYLGKYWHIFLFSTLLGIGSHHLLDWTTNPEFGPFKNTAIVQPLEIGPITERPLILGERTFEVVAMILMTLLILRIKQPARDFIKAAGQYKWIFWSLFFFTTAALMAVEWRENGGYEGVGHGVTIGIWAVSMGMITAAVLIAPVYRIFALR